MSKQDDFIKSCDAIIQSALELRDLYASFQSAQRVTDDGIRAVSYDGPSVSNKSGKPSDPTGEAVMRANRLSQPLRSQSRYVFEAEKLLSGSVVKLREQAKRKGLFDE
jgi:hypothetical protein